MAAQVRNGTCGNRLGGAMRKFALAMAVGATFVNAASAAAVTPVVPLPEPSGFVQLALGLAVLGGLAFVMRKRVRTNEAN